MSVCECVSPFVSAVVHGCASTSQFTHICDFLCYICSKVSIWLAGLDLVASNKLLFQCCLCSGLHRRQLCGLPPVPPQGEPYIRPVWLTDPEDFRHGASQRSFALPFLWSLDQNEHLMNDCMYCSVSIFTCTNMTHVFINFHKIRHHRFM